MLTNCFVSSGWVNEGSNGEGDLVGIFNVAAKKKGDWQTEAETGWGIRKVCRCRLGIIEGLTRTEKGCSDHSLKSAE